MNNYTLYSILVFLTLVVIYYIYQMLRNEIVFKIRENWIMTEKWELHSKISYNFMQDPNKINWYGLKYPNEKDYMKNIGTEPKEN